MIEYYNRLKVHKNKWMLAIAKNKINNNGLISYESYISG